MPVVLGNNSYRITPFYDYFEPDVEVGNFTSIADEVTFCGHMHHPCITHPEAVSTFHFSSTWGLDYFEKDVTKGKIVIGNDVWIGKQAFVMDGVNIGNGAIIGSRAVVASDILPFAIMIGNPAQIIRFRFTKEQIEKLEKIKWWNWEKQEVIARIADFKDINVFIEKWGKDL